MELVKAENWNLELVQQNHSRNHFFFVAVLLVNMLQKNKELG